VEVSPKKKSWGIPSAGPAYSHKGVARRRGMEAMLENAEKMLGGDSEGRPRQKDSSWGTNAVALGAIAEQASLMEEDLAPRPVTALTVAGLIHF
jgi:hypothetical protein